MMEMETGRKMGNNNGDRDSMLLANCRIFTTWLGP
jgi:hypothetical protein